MTIPAGTMLPNALERKQIFYLTKQWSSYTAWNRILGYFRAWAASIERSLQEASRRGVEGSTSLPGSDYALILRDLAYCEEGVHKLRGGDKRVFKAGLTGDFDMASMRAFPHWFKFWCYVDSGDMVVNLEATPFWNEFADALLDLNDVWSECSPNVIEQNDRGVPTGEANNLYGDWFRELLPKVTFPDALDEVPDPVEPRLVRTGSMVPCSGIWEPVDLPPKKIVDLFRPSAPDGPFQLAGCMNYLVEGCRAPKVVQETATQSLRSDTTWRLLWKDDRYLDGSIPEEEASYVFLSPKPRQKATVEAAPAQRHELIVQPTGAKSSRSGTWAAKDLLDVRVKVEAGDALPAHDGREIEWVFVSS